MIPMVDLKRQYADLKAHIDRALSEVLESTHFILGPNVTALEKEISDYHGVPDAIGVANGTDALRLALKACGIGAGDEVITTPFTFIATAEVILDVGATPVFVDVTPDTFNLDPSKVEASITDRTRAIIPVHLFGHPAPMDAIMGLAAKYDLRVIEDCAQAFGATFEDQMVGTFGDYGCYSFFPSKNLGCYGDGGMVIVKDGGMAEQIRMLRNHGSSKQYHHGVMGYNSRLDEIQAAILRIKLKSIDQMNADRRRNARLYGEHICHPEITLPYEAPGCKHVYHQFTLRCRRRDAIMARLKENRVAAALYYPVPLHRQKIFTATAAAEEKLPISEALSQDVVSLPMFPELTEGEIIKIARIINAALR